MKKTLFFIAALLCASLLQAQLRYPGAENLTPEQMAMQKLILARNYIGAFYVDSISHEKVTEDAIRGMLKELDPHSTYTNAEETRKLNEPLQGNFDGIGIQFNVLEDTLVVVQVIPGGPCEKMGVIPGDRIISVNDTLISGVKMDRNDMMKRMRGPRGTHAKLAIQRGDDKNLVVYDVVRDKIPLNTVDASYMIRPGVGYIRLSSFGAQSAEEVSTAIDSLKRKGMKKLVFDMQQNGGGYLNAAQGVASLFLKEGDLVVYTQGRGVPGEKLHAMPVVGDQHFDGKLVILVDEYTASAAEIVSGAVQDHDRGVVVGRRTFGKGLVQRPCYLPDGSMMRLTIARYYTPVGRCIQKPYVNGHADDYAKDMERRLKSGELTCRDSIHFADSLKYKTLKKGREVYGGGGIMPDVFVPLDTMTYTAFHRALATKNCVIPPVLRYIMPHRAELLGRYADVEAFDANFEVPDELWQSVLKEAEKAKVQPKDDEELAKTRPLLCNQIKALLARDLWDMSAYFCIWNKTNDIVNAALREL